VTQPNSANGRPEPDRTGGGTDPSGGGARPAGTIAAPQLTLPKGGGAIRGIDEKFTANPATGTGALTVPIATTAGRSGFGPRLALSYDSGSGNGPFGLGWSLRLPAITRKTEKGLPRYDDAGESDVFLLAGAEDLVPVLNPDASRFEDRGTAAGYVIHRYRPRVEGAFARIERWTRVGDGDVHWRSLSRDNVLTTYGLTAEARITDPADPRRVFSWLICESRDDRGNVVQYGYKAEDGAGVDLAAAHERNRGPRDDPRRAANRYLKRIRYGNRLPLLDAAGQRPRFLAETQVRTADWLFEVVLDYGEHDLAVPGPEVAPWAYRPDPFSSYRSGFEVRTARRCRRVLMFHHFPDEPDVGSGCLVRSTDFGYADEVQPLDLRAAGYSVLRAVTACGYRRAGSGYLRRSLPPVEFGYSAAVIQATVHDLAPALDQPVDQPVDLPTDLPPGRPGGVVRWADLHGEGAAGLLTEYAGAWYYRRNLSPAGDGAVTLAAVEPVGVTPAVASAGGRAQLMDLTGDGTLDVVVLDGPVAGYHEHDDGTGWRGFRPFPARLRRDLRDPNLRLVDLDSDGYSDVLVTEDDSMVWHPSLAQDGFGPAYRVPGAADEESGPRLVFADPEQSVHLADMTGDGLADLVRVRNGEICYWPNLGYGRFGAKISMDRSPHLDLPDRFDQRRVRLADADGSGPADLLYLAADGVRVYVNQSGNGWGAPQVVPAFPGVDDLATVEVADLLGTGTACLVWTSPLARDAARPLRYVDLIGGPKPHLLVRSVNNLGAETTIRYAPSTRFSTADRLAGRPWSTRLPFPVQVVERVETVDRISGNRFVTRYAYHDGYFDGVEREFRGFGQVDQWDTEEITALSDGASPPVLTRTWFHTGTDTGGGSLPAGLTLAERREAYRALTGVMLRQETYALDGTDRQPDAYRIVEQSAAVRLLQPQAGTRHAVFLAHPRETVTYHYERDPADPRVAHALTLDVDDFGNVLCTAEAGYGRTRPDPALSPADQVRQAERHITCAEHAFTNPVDLPDAYRAPLPCESRRYELADPAQAAQQRLNADRTLAAIAAAEPLEYQEPLRPGRTQKRLIAHTRTRYRPDDLGAALGDSLALLPAGRLESRALVGETLTLALTAGLAAACYGDKVTDAMLADDGGYVHSDGDPDWWANGGRVFLSPDRDDDPAAELSFARENFFLPHRFRDPFDRPGRAAESVVGYDDHRLAARSVRDAVGNTTTVETDYRVLQPRLHTDPNGNRTEAAFDALGMVVGTAVMGKQDTTEGDSLDGFAADLDDVDILAHLADPLADPQAILQRASTRVVYDVSAYLRTRDQEQPQPAVTYALARETHDADLAPGQVTRVQHALTYADGFGREIQHKAQAEPGPVTVDGATVDPRWVGSGWTVFDNKGQPVRRYEPFFTATHRFEFDPRQGVSPILRYDPVGRVVATLHPDHTWEKVVLAAWRQETWDAGDTVLIADPATDPDVGGAISGLPAGDYLPTWYDQRAGGGEGADEQAAAAATEVYAGTPAVAHADALGRTFLTVVHNRQVEPDAPPADLFQRSSVDLDIQGNRLAVTDALGRTVMRYDYDVLGRPVHTASMDAGERWTLADAAGQPVRSWDSRGHAFRTEFDPLRRPTRRFVTGSDPAESDPRVLGRDVLVEQTVYGEDQPGEDEPDEDEPDEDEPDDRALNLRGRIRAVHDTAGVVTYDGYDFKGNPLGSTRQLTRDHLDVPDWAGPVDLEPTAYAATTSYDALNRVTATTSPDGSVVRPSYNEAGLLERVDAVLDGEPTPVVAAIDYDSRGQRVEIRYGNGATTTYTYDPLTFRLTRLRTVCDGDLLQDLGYTYDPIGNITRIRDDAQQTVFFRNQRVEPSNDYRYDPTYQLIQAAGREQLGETPPDPFDSSRTGLPHPGDGNAMGAYRETYAYDAAGNILQVRHLGSDPAQPGWTRRYTYAEPSLIEPALTSNRLSATQVGTGTPESHAYDPHGNMTGMPQLTAMLWTFLDQLRVTSRQVVNEGAPETTYYGYSAGGGRVRKVTHRAGDGETATRKQERIYLGGFEIYREYAGDGQTVTLERETLHLMDGGRRVAMVETRTLGDDGSAQRLTRYQLGNQLGSSTVELDETGRLISYEEYYPYGATSYQAVDAGVRAAAKRYRYTGKERDEETGLGYHGARYYAPWLGRWTSADPAAVAGGINLYAANGGNPVRFTDPGGLAPEDPTYHGVPVKKGLNNAPLPPKLPSDPTTMQTATAKDPPRTEYTPAEQQRIEFNHEMAQGSAQASANERAALLPDVGAPGMAESFIPIWGSGRAAVHYFQRGNYALAGAYSALAVSDVFLVKSIAVAGLKLTAENAAAGAFREAMANARNSVGRQLDSDLIHWTSASGGASINRSNLLGGRWGLYAFEAGLEPTSTVGQAAWRALGPNSVPGRLFAGVTWKDLSQPVSVRAVGKYFGAPPMFGPWSVYRNIIGVRSAPLGYVDLALGEFFPGRMYQTGKMATRLQYADAVFHQWLMDYGVDGLLYNAPKLGLALSVPHDFASTGYTDSFSATFFNPQLHP
jgi:RHS repeat-associated protein